MLICSYLFTLMNLGMLMKIMKFTKAKNLLLIYIVENMKEFDEVWNKIKTCINYEFIYN
jgi:hypothetical protein